MAAPFLLEAPKRCLGVSDVVPAGLPSVLEDLQCLNQSIYQLNQHGGVQTGHQRVMLGHQVAEQVSRNSIV